MTLPAGNSGSTSAQPEPLPGGFIPPAPPANHAVVVDRAALESLIDSRMTAVSSLVAQNAVKEATRSLDYKVSQVDSQVKRIEDSITVADTRYKNISENINTVASGIEADITELRTKFDRLDDHTKKVVEQAVSKVMRDIEPKTLTDRFVDLGFTVGGLAGGISLGFLIRKLFIKTVVPTVLPIPTV